LGVEAVAQWNVGTQSEQTDDGGFRGMIIRQNLDASRIAYFSLCGLFRYALIIRWDDTKPLVANVGLNPSTATHEINDPTVYRDITRAAANGFGSFLKLNLFAFRSPSPKVMMAAPDPYGEWGSPDYLLDFIEERRASMVIAAWGNHGSHRGRSEEFRGAARERGMKLHKYALNQGGEPVHPLYLSYSVQPSVYELEAA
jgi:hypothetical protein